MLLMKTTAKNLFAFLLPFVLALSVQAQGTYFQLPQNPYFSDEQYDSFRQTLDSIGLVKIDSVSNFSVLQYTDLDNKAGQDYILRYVLNSTPYDVQELWLTADFHPIFSHTLLCYYDDCTTPMDYFLINLDNDPIPELVYWKECDETECQYYTAYDVDLNTNTKTELFRFIGVQALHDADGGYKVVEVPIKEYSFLETTTTGNFKTLDIEIGQWDTRKANCISLCIQYGDSPVIYKGQSIRSSSFSVGNE